MGVLASRCGAPGTVAAARLKLISTARGQTIIRLAIRQCGTASARLSRRPVGSHVLEHNACPESAVRGRSQVAQTAGDMRCVRSHWSVTLVGCPTGSSPNAKPSERRATSSNNSTLDRLDGRRNVGRPSRFIRPGAVGRLGEVSRPGADEPACPVGRGVAQRTDAAISGSRRISESVI